MKQLLIGIMLGSFFTTAPVLAFHSFGHNDAEDRRQQMEQEMFRNQQQQDRLLQQGPYRIPYNAPC